MINDLKESQIIFHKSLFSEKIQHITVVSIGRKWINLSNGDRIEKQTGKSEKSKKYYLTEQEYFDELKIAEDWETLKSAFKGYGKPEWVTPEKVKAILEIIKNPI